MIPYREPEQIPNEIHSPGLMPLYGNIYFHGTSEIASEKIWESGLWLSHRKYPMIWMSNNLEIVLTEIVTTFEKYYLERVLVLELDDSVDQELYETSLPGCYYLKLSDSLNTGNYYHVEGLKVIHMLDFRGSLLKTK